MSNHHPYEDQTYGSGRNLDRQAGRLSGAMRQEPIFLTPTASEFWVLLLVSCGVSMLLLVFYALLYNPPTRCMVIAGFGMAATGFALSYISDAFLRWRRKNYRYEMPR